MAADGEARRFERADLRDARFERTDLRGARFDLVDLRGARFTNAVMHDVVLRGVELGHVEIDGDLRDVRINGVDVAPLVEAELDRRDPDRVKLKASDPEGLLEAWDMLERRWDTTVARARKLDPELLHESVDGEWSFIQTLRHLVFATDAWIRRALLGEPDPWDPLDLPNDTFRVLDAVPRDPDARPSLDEVLVLREDRMATVREVLADLTEEQLAEHTVPVTEPGYPASESYPVRECLGIVLIEEWHHRIFAERDLAVLEERSTAEHDGDTPLVDQS
jgi:uncharacterized protein YjbI with pentapeptide repeats